MNYWLLKTEPDEWSWAQQCDVKCEPWSGVRNAQAQNNMKAMRRDDLAFFYHTGKQKQIVGIVKVVKTFYPDPSDDTGKFGCVDVAKVEALKSPITLKQIKADPAFNELALVRMSRLSVMPIDAASWQRICQLSNTNHT